MSSPDRKPDVVVAVYHYRHEAEFAAGFLDDAGIPYRLEADDAGGIDAGVTLTRPARIWVRYDDAHQAAELLEVTPDAVLESADADEAPARGVFIDSPRRDAEVAGRPSEGDAPRQDTSKLCGAERAVAFTLGAALTGLAMGFQDLLSSGPGGEAWVVVVVVFGVALLVSGLVGRSWGPLRSFLRALSGVAP